MNDERVIVAKICHLQLLFLSKVKLIKLNQLINQLKKEVRLSSTCIKKGIFGKFLVSIRILLF